MYRDAAAGRFGRQVEALGVAFVIKNRRKVVFNRRLGPVPPHATHTKDQAGNPCIPQLCAFFDQCNAKCIAARSLNRARDKHCTMAVCIALDRRQNPHPRPDMRLHPAEIIRQCV